MLLGSLGQLDLDVSGDDTLAPSPNRPLRVLIVEDTPERQDILTALYRQHAWILAHTGPRAIMLLRAYDFDIVSLDYNLGGELTGEDVAEFLASAPGKALRIIIHSMNPDGAARIKTLLPEAILYPVHRMVRSNRIFKKLQESISAEGVAYEWK